MPTTLILKALPWLVAALACFAAWFAIGRYLDLRDLHTAFVAQTEQAAKDAQAMIEAERKRGDDNLIQVRKDYEAKLPAIRAGAVRTYCLRQPTLCQPATASADASSQQVDDGAKPELMAPDPEFIRNAAEDAAKLSAFQDYCKRNNCPIEE